MQKDETNRLLLRVQTTVSSAPIRIHPENPGTQEKEAQSTVAFHYQRKSSYSISNCHISSADNKRCECGWNHSVLGGNMPV